MEHSAIAWLPRARDVVSCIASAALVGLAMTGCSKSKSEVDVARQLVEVSRGLESGAIVVTSPASCGSCSFLMVNWIEAIRREPRRVRLFFSRRPSERESDAWKLARIQPLGTVAGFDDLPVDVVVVARLRSGTRLQIDTVRTVEAGNSMLQEIMSEAR